MIRARALAVAAAALAACTTLTAAPATAAPSAGSAPSASSSAHRTHGPVDEIALPVGWQPEGITSDGGRTFWVGSLADGALYRGDLRTGAGKVLLPGEPGRRLVGTFYDRRSGLVWAVGALDGEGRVWAVDGSTGAVRAAVAVPGTGFLNDLVVTGRTVWVTDSTANDQLVRIRLGRNLLPAGSSVLVPLPDPWPRTGAFRANGIRALPDGSLVVVHSAAGLFRYVPSTSRLAPLPVTGTPAVVSGDGLELKGDRLWVVRGSGGQDITQLRLKERQGRWSATVERLLTSPRFDVPTTATFARGDLYAVNARFGNPTPTTVDYRVTRVDLQH